MTTIAIIPARGGSKGIPRKNLLMVAGKPLVAWSVETARGARSITRTIVSTDDGEIAAVARNHGAEVVLRPAEISGDTASSESALLHVLDTLRADGSPDPDVVVFLQATSPFRVPADIDGAVDLLAKGNYDSVFGGCPEHFTGRWALAADGCALPLNFDPVRRPRRQERAVEYLENGSVYAFRPRLLRETGSRMGGRIGIHPMPAERSHQIDSMEDVPFFETVLVQTQCAAPVIAALPRQSLALLMGRVRLLVLDFDGVMTDNRVVVDEQGREAVSCNRSDGLGLAMLKTSGISVWVLSTETNPVVAARCKKLGVPCRQGVSDKLSELQKLADDLHVEREAIVFVGNDVNDLGCLQWVGIPVAVSDAYPEVKQVAAFVTRRAGGEGAVREVVEHILGNKSTDILFSWR